MTNTIKNKYNFGINLYNVSTIVHQVNTKNKYFKFSFISYFNHNINIVNHIIAKYKTHIYEKILNVVCHQYTIHVLVIKDSTDTTNHT